MTNDSIPFIIFNPSKYYIKESLVTYDDAVALVTTRGKMMYMTIDNARRLADDIIREIEKVRL